MLPRPDWIRFRPLGIAVLALAAAGGGCAAHQAGRAGPEAAAERAPPGPAPGAEEDLAALEARLAEYEARLQRLQGPAAAAAGPPPEPEDAVAADAAPARAEASPASSARERASSKNICARSSSPKTLRLPPAAQRA